jgi:hypothetical protein
MAWDEFERLIPTGDISSGERRRQRYTNSGPGCDALSGWVVVLER